MGTGKIFRTWRLVIWRSTGCYQKKVPSEGQWEGQLFVTFRLTWAWIEWSICPAQPLVAWICFLSSPTPSPPSSNLSSTLISITLFLLLSPNSLPSMDEHHGDSGISVILFHLCFFPRSLLQVPISLHFLLEAKAKKSQRFHGLNVCVLPKFICWNPFNGIRRWGLW